MAIWVRVCQECGHKQVTLDPAVYKTDVWRNLKCNKCRSEALDYGSDAWTLVNGKPVPNNEE